MKVAVIGDGGWGTALALTLVRNGHAPRVWGPAEAYLAEIRAARVNRKFLPGVALPPGDYQVQVTREGYTAHTFPVRPAPDCTSSST